jgi:hypothetical protein
LIFSDAARFAAILPPAPGGSIVAVRILQVDRAADFNLYLIVSSFRVQIFGTCKTVTVSR